jgi:hypothetical protein
MLRILVGVLGGVLVLLMLAEIFFAFLLPRRVKRDPRIVRSVFNYAWLPWRRLARSMPAQTADTMLGIYGPFGLLLNLVLWIGAIMLGFACLQWANGSHLGPMHASVSFGNDLYFSAATMTTDGPASLSAQTGFARVIQVITSGTGLAVLAIVIGYLPSLYQAFSRREATVSQLDARAGSPPSAGRLVIRSTQRDGWPALNRYLSGWETWVAELMETHLAYPVLAYFRSQHVNQNWLSAMCTVLDTCAFTIAAAPAGTVDSARFTYAIARHAVVDLSYSASCARRASSRRPTCRRSKNASPTCAATTSPTSTRSAGAWSWRCRRGLRPSPRPTTGARRNGTEDAAGSSGQARRPARWDARAPR